MWFTLQIIQAALSHFNFIIILFWTIPALCLWCRYGSVKLSAAEVLQRIEMLKLTRNINLTVAWKPRSDQLIRRADLTLRMNRWVIIFNTNVSLGLKLMSLFCDDFGLEDQDFQYIKSHFGQEFTIDPFASWMFHRCKNYYTRFPCAGSRGSSGEDLDWEGEILYIHPVNHIHISTNFNIVLSLVPCSKQLWSRWQTSQKELE